nr:uncharacterized protein LOC103422617 [Malus domestica]
MTSVLKVKPYCSLFFFSASYKTISFFIFSLCLAENSELPTPTVFLLDLFAKIFSVSAAVATTLPQRNMDLLFSLCSAAHFPPKSHLKLFQFRTRDVRRRIWVYFEGIFLSVKLRSRFVRLS